MKNNNPFQSGHHGGQTIIIVWKKTYLKMGKKKISLWFNFLQIAFKKKKTFTELLQSPKKAVTKLVFLVV
jgi:hypothetical protein